MWAAHPRTRALVRDVQLPGVVILDPQPYLETQALVSASRAVLTDSGGLQKEAAFHQVPCVTLRDRTEWGELVEAGVNVLAGADRQAIVQATVGASWPAAGLPAHLYGDGRTAAAIAAAVAATDRGDAPRDGGPVSYFKHASAYVDEPCEIGEGTKIWHFCHIQPGARIGSRCIFGQNCNVANDVVIGNNVKVQNNVSIYTGTVIEDDVFLGPSCVLTNVTNPRSQVNRHSLYETDVAAARVHDRRKRDRRVRDHDRALRICRRRGRGGQGRAGLRADGRRAGEEGRLDEPARTPPWRA